MAELASISGKVKDMRKLELTCDFCGKTENGDEYHYGLPKGWYILGYHCQRYCYDDWRVTHHFCSLDCMDKAIKVSKQ